MNKSLYSLLGVITGSILEFFIPLWRLVFWMFVFVLFDTLTGIKASKKTGVKIQSKKLGRLINKLTIYISFIVLLHALDDLLPLKDVSFSSVYCFIVFFVEIYSIFENMYIITGDKVFYFLTQFTVKKFKEKTGEKITREGDRGE